MYLHLLFFFSGSNTIDNKNALKIATLKKKTLNICQHRPINTIANGNLNKAQSSRHLQYQLGA